MGEVDRFLIYLTAGIAVGSLLSFIRYGRIAVRLLTSIDEKLGGR